MASAATVSWATTGVVSWLAVRAILRINIAICADSRQGWANKRRGEYGTIALRRSSEARTIAFFLAGGPVLGPLAVALQAWVLRDLRKGLES